MHYENGMVWKWNEVAGVEWSDILVQRCINSDGTK